MSNKSELDYEKKFQDDLEKATALSLETLALEQYRRTKHFSPTSTRISDQRISPNVVKQISNNNNINNNATKFQTTSIQSRSRPGSFNAGQTRSDGVSPIAPPPSVPPRRHSEIRYTPSNSHSTDDLISFNTSPSEPKVEENANFDKLIQEIHKLNNQSQHVSINNQQYHTQASYNYGSTPSLNSAGLNSKSGPGMQLVVYNQQYLNKPALTNEELKKLYNMPAASSAAFGYPTVSHQRVVTYPPAATTVPIGPYNQIPSTQPPQPTPSYSFRNLNLLQVQSSHKLDNYSQHTFQNSAEQHVLSKAEAQLYPKIPKSASISGMSNLSSSSNKKPNLNDAQVLRRNKKTLLGDDLIDLTQEDNSRVSVLEAFDPLLSNDEDENGDALSDCTTSYYAEYDPFDYLYSCGTQYSDPVYEAVNKTDRTPISPSASIGWKAEIFNSYPEQSLESVTTPPPLPPRNSFGNMTVPDIDYNDKSNRVLDRRKTSSRLYEVITDRRTNEPELMAFYNMVKELRAQYKFDDQLSNVGHIVALEFDNKYIEEKSIKLLVHPALDILIDDKVNTTQEGQVFGYSTPIAFTCDLNTSVEHVLMHAFCTLEGQIDGEFGDFVIKPIGLMEWLKPSSKLSQLECVHDSIKLEKDVQLGMCKKTNENMLAIARTQKDDKRDLDLKPEDILPNETATTITYDHMMILIETLETEIDKLESSASDASPHTILTCSGVVQGVKAICALLGSIDTVQICQSIDELKRICAAGQTVYTTHSSPSKSTANQPDIISESGDYAEITLKPKTTVDLIKLKCNQIREGIQDLIETYVNAFRVDFCVKSLEYIITPIPISCVLKPIIVNVCCLHRPPPNWKYEDYVLGAQIYHGTKFIGDPVVTKCSNETTGGLFPRLTFDSWISFEKNPICTLPRESRLIFVLYGTEIENQDQSKSGNNDDSTQENKKITTELGWCAIQLFDFSRQMISGTYLLSLWPPTTDKFLGPAPAKGSHPQPDVCPVLSIEIPTYGGPVIFPETVENSVQAPRYDFNSLDTNLQQELLDTAEQGYPGALEKREVFWEKRHYLQNFPHALPKVLHAAHSWDYASLMDLHALLKSWKPLTPLQALELLLPRYPDLEVRSKAVEWISKMPNDQLVDFLPQLLQALKHDTYEASPMAKFLLCKCLESPRIAHHLYWLLVHSLPGDAPQNSIDTTISVVEIEESLITQARYHRRNKMMLRALLEICGEKLLGRFLSQNMMCKELADIAVSIKQTKESLRQKVLINKLETVHQYLSDQPTSLPLGPGLEVYGVNLRSCSYFNSYTLPLKIAFNGSDKGIIPAIFKAGDDLQQDMLTIQLVRVMDKLWLSEGLDLKMVTFNCVPTGYKKGMIELVSDAETLRKIQVEYGLTGSFKDRPIAEWLAKQNPSQLEYQRAVDNFTVSCAGYSVATYILGVCDRHNDNIMLKTSGHLFHIDFGKFLGDAQMFGNFKRDRTPFVLTSDMAYVINGGDKPSTKFHHFVDLCCRAFNIIRNHGDLLLHMLALMATAGIPGVTADAVQYVRKALLPAQSNPEAAASFAKMIQFSLKSWFTQFNFFLHNIAQMRFTSDDGGGELLSFVPRKYTMQQDGRLKSVMVHGYQKRYDIEKYYTYILRVTRHGQPDPAHLFRSYKEFLEFHQKLCLHFPLAKLHSLPNNLHIGRSNIKTVAERRLPEIQSFLISLFNSADEIAHSDLVYTFFHPLLRDQQEANINISKVKDIKPSIQQTANVCGELKISLQYRRGTLTVMIHHARGLPILPGGQEPNTYVKCYLKPDPIKVTKRKTKVVKKSTVPSFMETLEYRMPLEHIQNRILQVTVWSHDTLQENVLLGGFILDLSKYDLKLELIEWFRLEYLPRT
ncbi:phosphatidylinositol 4-phosphate 3-kinase C2 domain-containing subunit alpha [Condylostylus longicornis]|uniref:phosphatidylinositol 4-phosphate 3-kinase C2 domain-containing subunit alpha n=1 Tax=Condylostylus longicornis TaxID=2530218 RepID=UPI00244E267A|nr:phosphatidylinositol 4-phosphate 3-kinase C2 domain-containing subunit alpha [Condylostylus longicornis]